MNYDRVLIFGATGSLGHAVHRLWQHRVKTFIVFSRDENKHWKLKRTYPHLNIVSVVGDIGSFSDVSGCIKKFDCNLIIIMSAMKHVDYCEQFTERCIRTNVHGILNVIKAVNESGTCESNQLQKILFVSTDKACAPINVYGLSKSIAEHIVQRSECRVPVVGVRYGNVLNSSGSIIPIFQGQSVNSKNDFLTVTDVNMTRFIISLDDSVKLIEDAIDFAEAGEIFIPVVPAMKIYDLASLFSRKCKKSIQIVGSRPGEKIHESLFSGIERPCIYKKLVENRERYVLSVNICNSTVQDIPLEYSSNNNLVTFNDLESLLTLNDFL